MIIICLSARDALIVDAAAAPRTATEISPATLRMGTACVCDHNEIKRTVRAPNFSVSLVFRFFAPSRLRSSYSRLVGFIRSIIQVRAINTIAKEQQFFNWQSERKRSPPHARVRSQECRGSVARVRHAARLIESNDACAILVQFFGFILISFLDSIFI